jgi:outer membrane protein assembly factor BamB
MTARRPGRSSRSERLLVTVALVVLGVAACSAQPAATPVDPDPQRVGRPAPAAEMTQWAVPVSWDQAPAVDPGWDQRPAELDGLFLGLDIPDTAGHPVRYVATDSQGTVLWTAERPPTCTGFALSRTGGTPVAVLTDLSSEGTTTASAYELRSGELMWGPVDVPGAHQGPGLVFAQPAPALGATGPRVALDPATGAVVADEATEDGLTVVGEFDSVVLTAQNGALQAVDAGSGDQQWSLPTERAGLTAEATPVAIPGTEPPEGTALLAGRSDKGTATVGALVELDDGTVTTTDANQVTRDPATGVHVAIGANSLRALRDGQVLWSQDVPPSVSVAAAGGALVYLRDGDSLSIRNTLTGAAAVAYEGDPAAGFAVPVIVSTTGAAVVRTDGYVLLTAPPAGG